MSAQVMAWKVPSAPFCIECSLDETPVVTVADEFTLNRDGSDLYGVTSFRCPRCSASVSLPS